MKKDGNFLILFLFICIMAYDAVILDLGGVIINLDYNKTISGKRCYVCNKSLTTELPCYHSSRKGSLMSTTSTPEQTEELTETLRELQMERAELVEWAAFGSPGYLMTDDHFLTVEVTASWAVGENNGDWIPGWGNNNTEVEGFSFLYPGICFAFYKTMHALDVHDPQVQQLIFRLLHGLWSLLTVYYVFKLAERLGSKQVAVTAGLLMAFLGVMPLYVVRNLVEWVGHPFIIGGLYYLSFSSWRKWFLGAMFLGLAVGIRYQNAWIPIGWGIAYVLIKQWKVVFFTTGISFLFFFLSQIDDVVLWGGKPFQHVSGYLSYNATHSQDYPGSPLTYLSWISYFIFPPVSLFLLWGTVVPFFKKRLGIIVANPMIWGLTGDCIVTGKQIGRAHV